MPPYIAVPVVRHVQKGVFCYLGHLSAAQSRRLTFADSYPANPAEGRLGYQRAPNARRAREFAEYLRHQDSGFMTPILLNSRQPLDYVAANGSEDVGELRLKPSDRLAKIDGQHRGWGVEEFLGDEAYPVPFMLFEQLPEDEEQELFVAINREQKRVSMSHVLYVKDRAGDEDPITEIALRLNDDDRSPWYHRINVIGAAGTGRSVTLQGLREGLETLLGQPKIRALGDDVKYEIAVTYWRVVAETWPRAWENPKQHLLTKAVGLYGLSRSGSRLLPECVSGLDVAHPVDVDRLRRYLQKARDVDWRSDGEFAGLGGQGGAAKVSAILDECFYGRRYG